MKQSSHPGRWGQTIAETVAAGGLAALCAFSWTACTPTRERVVTSARTTTTYEQPAPPPTMVDISVVDLHDEPTGDPRMERVVGTIVNHGDRPVVRLSVRVDLLDDSGRLVDSVTTPPLSLTVAPLGGRATFEASVPRNPDVTTYHAVAVAR